MEIYQQAAYTVGPTEIPSPTPAPTPNCSGTCTYERTLGNDGFFDYVLKNRTCNYGCSCVDVRRISKQDPDWVTNGDVSTITKNCFFDNMWEDAGCNNKCFYRAATKIDGTYDFILNKDDCGGADNLSDKQTINLCNKCTKPQDYYGKEDLLERVRLSLENEDYFIITTCKRESQAIEPPMPSTEPPGLGCGGGLCKCTWLGSDILEGGWKIEMLQPCNNKLSCRCREPHYYITDSKGESIYVRLVGAFEGQIVYRKCQMDDVDATASIGGGGYYVAMADSSAINHSSGNLLKQRLIDEIAITGNTTFGYLDGNVVVLNNISFGAPLDYGVASLSSVLPLRKTNLDVINWDPNI
jgi:hypothetical protein